MRLCNASSPLSRNFELKTLDGTANPYLALAAVLGSGLEGIVNEKELLIKECGGEKSAVQLGEKGREELGIRDFKRKYLNVNRTLKEQMMLDLQDKELKFLVENY